MITIDFQNFSITIRIDGVIGKSDFVAFPRRIYDELVVQVEQKRAHVLIIDFSSAIGLFLTDNFPAVFWDERALLRT